MRKVLVTGGAGFIGSHLCDRLVARDDLAHARLDRPQFVGGERLGAREVVVEAVLDGRADGDLRLRPQLLHRFRQHVRSIVPQQLQSFLGIARDDGDAGVILYLSREVPQRAVNANRYSVSRQAFADSPGNLHPSHSAVKLTHAPVR